MEYQSEKIKDRNQKYSAYIKRITPKHNSLKNCIRAFFTGGTICALGQAILNWFISLGLDKDEAGLWMILVLIACSVILTCLNVFPSIVKWGGAGALVPITGFANGVCAPAMEFKKEGWVFGVGARIFQIAGPVILYGILASWLLGFGYWCLKLLGAI